MCLILFAYKQHPTYKLIIAANRDEFYERPTASLDWWEEYPNMLAGRDLKRGGAWFGISKEGKFAAVSNYREFPRTKKYTSSRGSLVKNYLVNDTTAKDYIELLRSESSQYEGFNLLFGNQEEIHYYSNKGAESANLDVGIYGLSNHLLNTPWPKVEKGKQMLKEAIENNAEISANSLINILNDTLIASDDELPDTGIGIEYERVLSPIFIKTEIYGTRSSSILLIDYDGHVTFKEYSFIPEVENEYNFKIEQSAD